MLRERILALVLGYFLDLMLGDPHNIWHPVCGIGKIISVTEKQLRKWTKDNAKRERIAGFCLVVIVCLISTGIPLLLVILGYGVSKYLGLLIEAIMCYQLLATKSLRVESMKVYKQLEKGDLRKAREAVSMIVGRDTASLDEEGVTKAAVETVAENTSDGIIAPMFFMAIGGPVLGFFYKAINTMDSMIGYKNDKYINLGRFAAKLDDVVNYIPARLSAAIMILATIPLHLKTMGAIKIYIRDRYNHASPNSAQTESVMAGALGVQLAGDAYYFGKLYKKKTIGDSLRKVEYSDIRRANQLLYMTSFLTLLLFAAIYFIILS